MRTIPLGPPPAALPLATAACSQLGGAMPMTGRNACAAMQP